MPRIEITLSQVRDNARILSDFYKQKGLSLMGVSKSVLGEPLIVEAMIQGGVKFIADSRIENIQKIRKAGIATQLVLLRTPASQAESVIQYSDISLNTEIETLKQLSHYAKKHNKTHQVILMVELGDLREGILPGNLSEFVRETLALSHIKLIGLGCNLACYGGIKPDQKNMRELTALTEYIEKEFQIRLEIISGGNSANYEWYQSTPDVGRINNLRVGESILLGCETTRRSAIPGLHTHAFQLIAEVIESKKKASLPSGKTCQDAFGDIPKFKDRGIRQRALLALGRQDIDLSGIKPIDSMEMLGASSDHIIIDSKNQNLKVGDEVMFDLNYSGLLAAMTSPFVKKQFTFENGNTAV